MLDKTQKKLHTKTEIKKMKCKKLIPILLIFGYICLFIQPITIYGTNLAIFDQNSKSDVIPTASSINWETINLTPSYSSYFGGSGSDWIRDILIDSSGYVFIIGNTMSTNFPTTSGTFDETFNGEEDVFVMKITPDYSSIVYSTLIGGSDRDLVYDSHLNDDGSIIIAGVTYSNDFPTTSGAFDEDFLSNQCDYFFAKVNPTGTALEFATYVGGTQGDYFLGFDVDSNNDIYFVGNTWSSNFPITSNAYDSTFSGSVEAVLGKLDSTGSTLLYSTFIGGSSIETIKDIYVESVNNTYLVGTTTSSNFPTTSGAYQETYGSNGEGFIMNFNISALTVGFSSYFGGNGVDVGHGKITLNTKGNIVIAGTSESTNLPVSSNALQTLAGGGRDLFVAVFDSTASTLLNCTYLGGNGDEYLYGLELTNQDEVILTGATFSTNLLVSPNCMSDTLKGTQDGYVYIINSELDTLYYGSYIGGEGTDFTYSSLVYEDAIFLGNSISSGFPSFVGGIDDTFNGGTADGLLIKLENGILPDAPVLNPIISPDNDGDFIISWSSVSGADEYHLYRNTSSFSSTSGLTSIYQGSSISFNEIDLAEGNYYYGVVAVNSSGSSELSNIENVVVDYPNPPSEPTLSSISSPDNDGDFSISWSSVSGANEYHLYRNTSSFSSLSGLTPIYQGSSTSYNEIDLAEGDYYYGVVAVNSSGVSDLSNIENVVVDYPPPNEPTLSSISSPDNDGDFIITWSSVSGADEYHLYRHTSSFSSVSGLTPIYQGSSTSYGEIDLSEGDYYFGVIALNANGSSDLSNIEYVVVDYPDPPNAPILSSIPSPDDNGYFTVSWNSVSGADEYHLYRHTSSFSSISELSPIYISSSTSYDEIDLAEGDYYYGVIALNSSGTSGISNIENVVVDYPDPPGEPTLSSISSPDSYGNFLISWTDVINADAYKLYRSSESFTDIAEMSPIYVGSTSNFNEYNLEEGIYYYRVVAVNSVGESNPSNIQSVSVEIPSGTDPTNNNFLDFLQKYGVFGLLGFGVIGGVIAISIIRKSKLKTLKDIHKSQNIKSMGGSSLEFKDPPIDGNIGMNICPNCQGKNPPRTSFCVFCGLEF
jgi:hypothetical protein